MNKFPACCKQNCAEQFILFPLNTNDWLCSVQGDKDFTPAAAQVAHQKPQPCVPKLAPVQHLNQHIHQPRKWARQQATMSTRTPPAGLPQWNT